MKPKQNWFETLNAALESEGLVDQWPLGTNISYGQTVRVETDTRLISVTRENDGRYERPVHYARCPIRAPRRKP
jgi:hypothetical protein